MILLTILSLCFGLVHSTWSGQSRPNIVFIMADDMGINDVSFHGSNEFATPNIDALGYNGVMFNRHYSQQSCTPSRAALLTGNYPIRTGMQGFPSRPGEQREIPHNLTTLPKLLKELGYATSLVGKWHLGFGHRNSTPPSYGYDTYLGFWSGFIGYFDHIIWDASTGKNLSGVDLHENLRPITDKDGVYFTDLITQRAVEIIRNSPKNVPLFLQINHLAPHTGRMIEDLVGVVEVSNITQVNEQYGYIKDEIRRRYADAVVRMDHSVGQIVTALKEKGLLDNTLVIFISDNGAPTNGMFENRGSNFPFRGLKMTLFEGGVRTAAAMYARNLHSRGRTFSNLMHITDWLPTIYAAAGGDTSKLQHLDGKDQWKNIAQNKNIDIRREILLNIDEATHYSGIIGESGRFKLINNSFSNNIYDGFYGESGRNYTLSDYFTRIVTSPTNKAINPYSYLSSKKVNQLRSSTTYADCRDDSTIVTCKGKCLFDLKTDPCEKENVAGKFPKVEEALWKRIMVFNGQLVPQQNKRVDVSSDPAQCRDTWFNWLDGNDGCWFNTTKAI